ncbi:MAG TPA: DUF1778 domain-containing protein [Alphaproteobacteria bacterium]|nr:DUF1778 domain-containing protein [Alphaproteobacteria bacterium]
MSELLNELKEKALVLSNEDRDLFIKHLQNPPKPNNKLKAAWDRYKRVIKGKEIEVFDVELKVNNSWCEQSSLSDYEFEKVIAIGVTKIVYHYEQGCYEGGGDALLYKDGKWYLASLSHCSCYGPMDHISFGTGHEDPMEWLKHSSAEYNKTIKILCEKAKEVTPDL